MKIGADKLQGDFDDSQTASDPNLPALVEKARQDYTAALANDLNTAEAIAAVFELVRAGNAAGDAGTLRPSIAKEILQVLDLFNEVFAVLQDRDFEITQRAVEWAKGEGREGQVSPDLLVPQLSDADIDTLVAERTQAKKNRNFARADAIRNDLLAKGILIEDSKDGVRWKRK
jgi:cysteinyl-tRNA synthetase